MHALEDNSPEEKGKPSPELVFLPSRGHPQLSFVLPVVPSHDTMTG